MKPSPSHRRGGYVIFAVLIVVVVLSLVAYRFTDSMTGEYRAGVRANDNAQVKLAAVSGLHYAAAILSDREAFYSDLDANPFDNRDIFDQIPVSSETGRKQAFFSVRSVALVDGGNAEQRFGVIDEGGKLNINSMIALDGTGELLVNALMKLPNMTEEVAAAIVDWVDTDDEARPGGAESSNYQSLPNPYKAKNGPLNSLDELLLVQGVTPALLYGSDTNRNGVFDEGELGTDRGLADYLTVYGRELNVDMSGTVRIYLNGDDLAVLAQQLTPAIGEELTQFIIASKVFRTTKTDASGNPASGSTPKSGNSTQPPKETVAATPEMLKAAVELKLASTFTGGTRLKSQMDLIYSRITLPRPPGTPPESPDVIAYSPLLDPTKRAALLTALMNRTTVKQAVELVPRINVNTAPREVLLGVPSMTEDYADAIMRARPELVFTDPATVSGAWLVTKADIPPDTFKKMEKYITGTSMVYRVQAIGYFTEGGPTARMEAVIDTNQGAPRFLHIRDLSDLENPKGFPN